MKKYKNIIIGISLMVVVIFLVFCLSTLAGNKYFASIDNKEYKDVIKDDAVVFIGNDDEKEEMVKAVAKDNNFKIYLLDSDKDEKIEVWKDGKLVSSYDFKELSRPEDENKSKTSVNIDQYVERVKADGYNLLYVGRVGCTYCERYTESVNDLLKTYNINVYYLDISDLNEEGFTKLANSDSYFATEEWGTPTTMLYKDGQRVNMLSGYVDSNSLIEFVSNSYITQFLKDSNVIK